jgi:hypothetical protein
LIKITTFIGDALLVSRFATADVASGVCPCDGLTVTFLTPRPLKGVQYNGQSYASPIQRKCKLFQ